MTAYTARAPLNPVRYVEAARLEADLETKRQAELAAKRGPSLFFELGPGGRDAIERAAAPKIIPVVIHKGDVADIASERLDKMRKKAGPILASHLAPLGYRVKKPSPEISRPFATDKDLVHLCEAEVCRIMVKRDDGSDAMYVVKMTNFSHGHAVITEDGKLEYRGVTPSKDARLEKPSFRVLGFSADENGKPLAVDPSMTKDGMAWNVDNVGKIVDKMKEAVVAQRQRIVAKQIEAQRTPQPAQDWQPDRPTPQARMSAKPRAPAPGYQPSMRRDVRQSPEPSMGNRV